MLLCTPAEARQRVANGPGKTLGQIHSLMLVQRSARNVSRIRASGSRWQFASRRRSLFYHWPSDLIFVMESGTATLT